MPGQNRIIVESSLGCVTGRGYSTIIRISAMRGEVDCAVDWLAEGVGFEPTVAFTTPVFKTGPL